MYDQSLLLQTLSRFAVVLPARYDLQKQLSEQLQHALESRMVIEQAKGITASKHCVTIDAAYQLIRRQARNNNASLRTVAEAIVSVGLHI